MTRLAWGVLRTWTAGAVNCWAQLHGRLRLHVKPMLTCCAGHAHAACPALCHVPPRLSPQGTPGAIMQPEQRGRRAVSTASSCWQAAFVGYSLHALLGVLAQSIGLSLLPRTCLAAACLTYSFATVAPRRVRMSPPRCECGVRRTGRQVGRHCAPDRTCGVFPAGVWKPPQAMNCTISLQINQLCLQPERNPCN